MPTEREACFFVIAEIVVTSSGSEVPIATAEILIIRVGTPSDAAIAEPLSTSSGEPIIIPAQPITNIKIFLATTAFVTSSLLIAASSDWAERFFLAERIFS